MKSPHIREIQKRPEFYFDLANLLKSNHILLFKFICYFSLKTFHFDGQADRQISF